MKRLDHDSITKVNMEGCAVALGKFDGIHKGHQLLLEELAKAKTKGLERVVFTFVNPYQNCLSIQDFEEVSQSILTIEERAAYFEKQQIDYLVEYPFTREFAAMEPEEFVESILVACLHVKLLVVGVDFRFGRERRGDVALLRTLGEQYGFQVMAMEKKIQDATIISSSLIRSYLHEGNLAKVHELLGRPYSIRGEIVQGNQLGRTIGMPTANQLIAKEKLIPPYGVYGARVEIHGKVYYGISNLGKKPTVGNQNPVGLETCIFDFTDDIYGEVIETELLFFVRGERKYQSLEALQQQMKYDTEYVISKLNDM